MLKKEQYTKTVKRPYNTLLAGLIIGSYIRKASFRPFLGTDFHFKDLILSDGEWLYSTSDLQNVGKLAFDYWKIEKNFIKCKALFLEKEKILLNSEKDDFQTFKDKFESYVAPSLQVIYNLEKPITEKMIRLLSNKLSKSETEELMQELNVPLEDNYYKNEEYELANCNTDGDLKAHVKKYIWLNSRYGSENYYTIEQAKEKLSKMNKDEFLDKYKKEKEEVKKAIKKAKNLLGKDDIYVDLMQYIIYFRTQRTDVLNRAFCMYIPEMKKIAKNNSLTYEELLYCMPEEILKGIPSKAEIGSRIKDFAIVIDNAKLLCFSGNKSKEIRDFLTQDLSSISELKGQSACKGYVKGTVKVIISADDFKKINLGDILVTSMTTPNMIAIMKKASAFVTDEGGITCHAAIISREMKKPCIIGTKFATKVLKDGDLIEVDADKGTVKKL
ncbi:MAG: PEP-utilizing enzyme [Nanoarchaeota archaeon]